jgi:NAD(P)-dependent dehydrogenase (short-subunit alcohol dehydrogenase family)
MSSRPLDGKAALITGASRGIGRAVVLRLAADGAAIYLAADGTAAELEDVAAAARECGAPDAAWGLHDLARADEPEAMVAAACQRMRRIDILVNNAGIRVRKAFGEFSHKEFERVVAINLRAPFFASQAVVPIMRAQGGGHVPHGEPVGPGRSHFGSVYNVTRAASSSSRVRWRLSCRRTTFPSRRLSWTHLH